MSRKRGPSKYQRSAQVPPRDVTKLAYGGANKEFRRGTEWFVREIPAHRADKAYVCPDCPVNIPVGQAHVVAWSAEHLFGNGAALQDRRHYHAHCWRLP